ncbi:thioesterase [Muriicola marianensis]|uniref:Thioesterase n=2 Tax=Muriicola marianensis TaxID=1324801 RepID=A0ABQ1QN96_9FLAO|nr:thioesterase [Muriicola marianensis]
MLNFVKTEFMSDHKAKILEVCNQIRKNTLMETLDIEYVDVGENFLIARMPVSPKVHQPDGVLHGGATVALAESVGSAASYVFLDGSSFFVRGIEIAANHVKSIREGWVYAKASIVHKGRTTQLWEIRITDEEDRLVSLCKLTTIALPKK